MIPYRVHGGQARFPLEPLLALAGTTTKKGFARSVGVSYRSVCRWARAGVPELSADHVAARLGFHPVNVWGDSYLFPTLGITSPHIPKRNRGIPTISPQAIERII